MLNLYWKSRDQTRSLVEKPFDSEAKLEQYVFCSPKPTNMFPVQSSPSIMRQCPDAF